MGNIVRIRKETDPEALKRFTPEENRIRNEWLRKSASQISEENYNTAMENIKNMFKSMADKWGEMNEHKCRRNWFKFNT